MIDILLTILFGFCVFWIVLLLTCVAGHLHSVVIKVDDPENHYWIFYLCVVAAVSICGNVVG